MTPATNRLTSIGSELNQGGSSSMPIVILVVIVVIVLPLVAGLVVLAVRSRKTGPSAPAPSGPALDLRAPGATAPAGADPALVAERDRLGNALLQVRDRLDSIALRAWIDEALGRSHGPDVGTGRQHLVAALIDVRDQVQDPALRTAIAEALAGAGVVEVVVDGQRFDPSAHRALDYVATADPAHDHLVAQTSRPGYLDRGRVLRAPDVLVYRAGSGQ